MSTFVYQDGVCLLDQEQVPLEPGALTGDRYCQIYLEVEMGDCNGCPDYQKRIEVYSNGHNGCPEDEFVVYVEPVPEEEPVEPEEKEPEETEEKEPEETEETPTPGPGPGPDNNEDSSSMFIQASKALIPTLAALLIGY